MIGRKEDGTGLRTSGRRVRRPWFFALLIGLLIGLLLAAGIGFTMAKANADNTAQSTGPYVLPLVVGAVPYWDEEQAQNTIDNHSDKINVASPWSYAVAANGTVQLQPGLNAAHEQTLATNARNHNLKVIPTVANTTSGLWDSTTISTVMSDSASRTVLISSIVDLIKTGGFDGIQIDFENLPGTDRNLYSAFLGQLADGVHQLGKLLYVTVHAKETDQGYDQRNVAQDYAAIGKVADAVSLMAYDWHWGTGPSGPIAPYDWVERVVKYSVTQIPRQKILLGVGLFGYDWVGTKADNLTWAQLVLLAQDHAADEQWDVGSQSPHFEYDSAGQHHVVWYENGRSVTAKVGIAREYRLGGVEFWRLGGEDPAIWDPAQ